VFEYLLNDLMATISSKLLVQLKLVAHNPSSNNPPVHMLKPNSDGSKR
jgi:hypothetical protein